jgi:hypothetical protein
MIMRNLQEIDQACARSEAVANQLKRQIAGLTALVESLVEPLQKAGIEVDVPAALAAIAEQAIEAPVDEKAAKSSQKSTKPGKPE